MCYIPQISKLEQLPIAESVWSRNQILYIKLFDSRIISISFKKLITQYNASDNDFSNVEIIQNGAAIKIPNIQIILHIENLIDMK